MSQYIENHQLSANQVEHRQNSMLKTKKLYLGAMLLSTLVLIVSVILFVIFMMQYNSVKGQINDYETKIDNIKTKIHDFQFDRLLNLSNSNIVNVGIDISGNQFTAVDLSVNNIKQITVLRVPDKFKYIDLTNNPLQVINYLHTQSIDDIKLPATPLILQNCSFQFEKLPESFQIVAIYFRVSITGMPSLIFKNRIVTYFINNDLPDTKQILFVNSSLQKFIHKSQSLQEVYVQSFSNSEVEIQIEAYCNNGITMDITPNLSLSLSNVKLVDMNKIKALNLKLLQLINTTIANLQVANYQWLVYLSLQRTQGINQLAVKNQNIKYFYLNSTSIQILSFYPQQSNLKYFQIFDSEIRVIKNLYMNTNDSNVNISFNKNFKQFTNNTVQLIKQIILSPSLVSFQNNSLTSLVSMVCNYEQQFITRFPNLQKFNNNQVYFSNLYFPNSKLSSCNYNYLYQVKTINLSNNNLDDTSISNLASTNTWAPSYVKYINLKNNPIKNITEVLTVLGKKFPNAQIDI